jgi:hypothetical protein
MYVKVLNELGNSSEATTYVNFVRARPSFNMPATSNNLNYDEMFEQFVMKEEWDFPLKVK